jgi:hypothetical protein
MVSIFVMMGFSGGTFAECVIAHFVVVVSLLRQWFMLMLALLQLLAVSFVCKCVLYCCSQVSTQLQLNIYLNLSLKHITFVNHFKK